MARNDGTMYTGFYDRQVVVTVITEGSGTSSTRPEDKRVIPSDNILNYEIASEENDRVIIINVRRPLMFYKYLAVNMRE